ncbi:MAG: VOC family protein [Candidatus Dormibacteraeota bacterium]|nr:VOC family protein [Candidatus Dormibacteraeota bacterium]
MLQDSTAGATIPASDLARARAFYEGKLGLKPAPDLEDPGGVMYRCKDGTRFLLFESSGASSGNHTQISFEVEDVDEEISALRAKGVTFEEYDFPGLKTENGITQMPTGRGGWFKDTEGNLLSVFQRDAVVAPSPS